MKIRNIKVLFNLFLLTLLFITGCNNISVDSPAQNKKSDGDIAYIKLNLQTPAARDIYPTINIANFTTFLLSGKWQGQDNDRNLASGDTWAEISGSDIPIQTGNWDFTLRATSADGRSFIATLDDVDIGAGTTSLSFTLAAENNQGHFSIAVSVDKTNVSSNINLQLKFTLYKDGVEKFSPGPEPYSGTAVTFSPANDYYYDPGDYDMEIKLIAENMLDSSGNSIVLNTYKDKLHVIAGFNSTKSITITANPVYDISYEANGGTISEGSAGPALFSRKSSTANLPTLTKPGYNFLGWFDEATGGTQYTDVSISSTTYYARFTPKSYTVKHYFQPVGTSTDPDDYVQDLDNAPDQTITISGNPSNETTTATAYTITGFENQTITQATSIADDDSTVVNVYYNRQSFNVSYTDGQGNTLSGGGQYQFGATVNLIFDNYTPPAYHDFECWNDGTNTYTEEDPSFEMPAVDVVLEAQSKWTEHYINLYIYGGALGEHTGKYTITITKETATVYEIGSNEWIPTRSHYTFGGWYTDKECTTPNTVTEIDPYEEDDQFHDWNFYAKWTQPAGTPEGFVYVYGATVSETVTGSPVFTGTSVQIPDLYVCEHAVTQGEYETYCKYSGSYTPSTLGNSGTNKPVFLVNWYDAIIYCNLRSADEGLNSVYTISGKTDPSQWPDVVSTTSNGKTVYCSPGSIPTAWSEVSCDFTANGYRLPKEVEWEYCALGGEAGIPSTLYTYSGSNDANDVAWYKGNSGNVLHDVKTKIANSIGIYDMSGNEGEWCWDFYNGSTNRVIRDSSFSSDLQYITVFDRGSNGPDVEINGTGFRVFRTAQ